MWTQEQSEYLINNYGKLSLKEISKNVGKSHRTTSHRARILGLKGSVLGRLKIKHICNDRYFRKIHKDSCYWAGVLAADGCVQNKKHISMSQCSKNKELVRRFILAISCTSPMHGPKIARCNGEEYEYYSINFTSPEMVSDLKNNFSITERKSLTLQPPNLSKKEDVLGFISGYIDGDGCIGYYFFKKNQKYYTYIGFCGTEPMMVWIKKHCEKLLNKTIKKKIYHIKNRNCYEFNLFGKNAELFLKLLKDNNILSWKAENYYDTTSIIDNSRIS